MANAPRQANSNGPVDAPIDFLAQLEANLIERMNAERYDLWFRRSAKFVWLGDQLIVGVANRFSQDWLQKNFQETVEQTLITLMGGPVPVRFVTDPELFRETTPEEPVLATLPVPSQKHATATNPPKKNKSTDTLFDEVEAAGHSNPRLEVGRVKKAKPTDGTVAKRRWKNLDDFISGAANRVAHAAALNVIEDPTAAATPLIFYGPTGTGKTHLLEGIYLGLRRHQPQLNVRYLTAEDFMNRFVQAMYYKKQPQFRKQFRACDVLLIDDLTFLAGKQATQIEFLHTYDALMSDGCVVIATCDCHPRQADDLMPELVDRLLGGAVWSMMPPDYDTRLKILRAKSFVQQQPMLSEEILTFLAERLRGNVRELEGAMHTLKHYARAMGQPVDVPMVREALAELLRHAVKMVSIADVEAAIAKVLALQPGILRSNGRSWSVSHPRMLAIYLSRKHTAASYSEIATYFQQKTHSTAVASEKRVKAWIQANEPVKCGQRTWKIKELIERVESCLGTN